MIEIHNLTKVYVAGSTTVKALDGINLTIPTGQHIAIVGPSGSGKSTLMNMLGALDTPTSGQYLLNGEDVSKMSEKQLARVRNKNIGFVFQRYNLMGRMSARRNVELPARYSGFPAGERAKRATLALESVGLADKVNSKPTELSGGQQQRVAIARALVNQPTILMADEPTGALDSRTGIEILELFEQLHRERNMTLIVVTHDPSVASRAQRVVFIRDGKIERDESSPSAGSPRTGASRMSAVTSPAPSAVEV